MESEIKALLEGHGISTVDYGKGEALGLEDLAREARAGLCVIAPDKDEVLARHVSLVEVSLVADLPLARLVLVEQEQVLDDGRRRQRPPKQQKLHAKLRPGEAPVDGARRALVERLALSDLALKGARALAATTEAPAAAGSPGAAGEADASHGPAAADSYEAESTSYPGLRTRYAVHRVTLRLLVSEVSDAGPERQAADLEREALVSHLGLPLGRSFMSVEGSLGAGAGGRVHLWRWALAEADQERRRASEATSQFTSEDDFDALELEEEHHDDSQGAGRREMTPLEQADRDVRAALRLLERQKASLHERGGPQESQIRSAQDRLRRVLRRFANVESLVSVNTNTLFGANTADKAKRLSQSLVRFIKNNFVSEGDSDGSSPKRSGHLVGLSAGSDAECLSPVDESLLSVQAEVEALRQRGAEHSWVLDCLELHEQSGRRALMAVAELLVVPLAGELWSSEQIMRNFVWALHARYEENPNPFHNEAHAAVVCHSTHWLAARLQPLEGQRKSGSSQVFTDIAAIAHDVGHFGRNNLFCANRGNELALRYNDRSILENMHASTCFEIMQGRDCNVLRDCTPEKRKKCREQVVDLILATDMSSHFDFIGKLRLRASSAEFAPQDNQEDKRLLERGCLKAADLGHAALPWEIHERWALRLLREFYEQGDEERSLGLPVSPLCDRTGKVSDFQDSQKGFLSYVILPLFRELALVTSQEVGETCVTRLEVNAEYWVKTEPSAELVAIVEGSPGRSPGGSSAPAERTPPAGGRAGATASEERAEEAEEAEGVEDGAAGDS